MRRHNSHNTVDTGFLFIWNRTFTLRKKCPYLELFWSTFSRIRTPFSVRMQKNADKNNSKYERFLHKALFFNVAVAIGSKFMRRVPFYKNHIIRVSKLCFCFWLIQQLQKCNAWNDTLCAIGYHFYNLKNLINTHGGVLLLVNLCNYSNSNIPQRVFFTFFKFYKWYQVTQSI